MNKQQNKQKLWTTHIYINISCKCDTNRAGHFPLDAYASRPVACSSFGVLQQATHSCIRRQIIFFSYDQAALWMVNSVRLSVCHTLFTVFASSYHREILGVITNDQSEVHTKRQGQKSKVKVAEVKTQLNPFRTVTPVSINIWWWWWNDTQSLMLLRRWCALLFFKVIHQILRSHETKNIDFDCNSSQNSLMAMKRCTKLEAT